MSESLLLERSNTALMVVDVQGKLARTVVNSDSMVLRIRTLVKSAQLLNLPIIWLEQYPEGLGKTIDELSSLLLCTSTPSLKTCFNALDHEHIKQQVEACSAHHFLVCGIEAHVCVYQTVAGLIEQGASVSVIDDACSSRTLENKTTGIQRMLDLGASVRSSEMAIFELIQDAADPLFKQILPLIK